MKKYVLFFTILIVGTVLDIASKNMIFEHFQVIIHDGETALPPEYAQLYSSLYVPRNFRPPITLIPDFLEIRVSFNRGAVWGCFQGQVLPLTIFSLVAFGVILFILIRNPPTAHWLNASLGLIAAGAAGNLWDRLHFQGVRDFIHAYIGAYDLHWPIFNLADVWIVVGIAGMILLELFAKKKTTNEAAK